MQIWDTYGQERYGTMAPMFCRGASIALLVYDITSPDSRDSIQGWYKILMDESNTDTVVVVVAAKGDLKDEISVVDPPPVALSEGLFLRECSSKTGEGVNEIFEFGASQAYARLQAGTLLLPNDPHFRNLRLASSQPSTSASSSSPCYC